MHSSFNAAMALAHSHTGRSTKVTRHAALLQGPAKLGLTTGTGTGTYYSNLSCNSKGYSLDNRVHHVSYLLYRIPHDIEHGH
jgi:hypothetical protein